MSEAILTAAQMRSAEQALIAAGTSVDTLMQRAGRGAAAYVWRLSGGRPVTVLCGPGNNGGDGYVIAEAIRERGGEVRVIAAAEPATEAARAARASFAGIVRGPDAAARGEVFVDCLFGTGLTRRLSAEHFALLERLAANHHLRVAIDLPSGVDADLGLPLGRELQGFDLTLALGALKFAHVLMPAAATMGALRLVPIGVTAPPGAARLIGQPHLTAPAADAHKYSRGLLAVIGGAMPGAAVLAARAAQGAGAGYVKLLVGGGARASAGSVRAGAFSDSAESELVEGHALPADLVADTTDLADALTDRRLDAVLIGPGLGRGGTARERLAMALSEPIPAVLDAEALVLLAPRSLAERAAPVIATPHEGELLALERAFDLDGTGTKVERAVALARISGMVVVAKGADSVVAAPGGRIACAGRATSWLSTAGTGDVLAGIIASRLASGADPFTAACDGLWLHAEAARLCPSVFAAAQLAAAVPSAYAHCL